MRRFDTRITLTTLGASAGATAVARVLLGDVPDFRVEPLPYPGFGTVPIYLALGVAAGCLGVAYNRTLLGTLAVAERLQRFPVELRAAMVGALVGLTAWFAPDLVGGGDAITQRVLAGTETLIIVSVVFILRFGLGALSYAAGTVTEMTASFTLLLPMLAACFAAMVVPTLLRDTPIYDVLRQHALQR